MTERRTCGFCGAPVSGAHCIACGEAVAMQPPSWNRAPAGAFEPDATEDAGWTEWPDDVRTPRLIRPYVPVGNPADDDATAKIRPITADLPDDDGVEAASHQDMYEWRSDEDDIPAGTRWRSVVTALRRPSVGITLAILAALAVAAVLRLVVFPADDEPVDFGRVTGPTMPVIVDPSITPAPVPSTTDASPGASPRTPPASAANVAQPPATTAPPATATGASKTAPAIPRTVPIVGSGGRCIDNGYGRQVDQNPVVMFQCNGSGAQQWTFAADSTIRTGGYCLQISFGYIAERGLTQISTCNGSQNQQWTVRPDNTLVHAATGRCLHDATSSGAGVMNPYTGTYWGEVVTCNGSAAQRWTT